MTLTKSRWCIQDSVPNGSSALPKEFCAYGDKVISTLEDVFNIPATETFEFELDAQTGGAHTGTSCGHLGDGVAYDAFSGAAYGATGFWGYLLSMHEAINDWTGMASSGWPTDWWADHQSAFPNLMDFHIMDTIGVANGDSNLVKAAAAQKKRFYPGGDSHDAKVVALDNVYAAMPNGDGFAGFSAMFALLSHDGVKWDGLGVPNPDVKRSEYVVAYMSLAAHERVLALLQGPSANAGGGICNNTPDGTQADKPYTCSAMNIDSIATAHCSIAANGKPAADLSALRAGKYANLPSGPCGAMCPGECACDGQQRCVAAWLVAAAVGGSGAGAGVSGAAGKAGASGQAGVGTVAGAAAAGRGGATAGRIALLGAGKGGAGAGASPDADGGANVAAGSGASPASGRHAGSGCGCQVGGRSQSRAMSTLEVVLTLLLFARGRRRFAAASKRALAEA
jgi:hypothetical protein